MGTQWVVIPRPNPKAAIRLICVPHAGGGVSSFRGWSERLGIAEVGIVELPGRGSRLREPVVESVTAAADGLVEALSRGPAAPTALFGHGLGALIAFEAARRLEARGWPMLALFVSGRRAPSLPASGPGLIALPLEQLVEEAQRRSDVIPLDAALDRDSIRLLIPGVRADFAMLDGLRLSARRRRCDARSLPAVPPRIRTPRGTTMTAWRAETSARFSLHIFAGDASYLQREREAVTALIANQLSVMVSALARWSVSPVMGASIHIWTIALDEEPAMVSSLLEMLSGDERVRAARFRTTELRKRFVVAHGALRTILSGYLGIPPAAVRFDTSGSGKPYVPGAGLTFNLSRSEGLALCAITVAGQVGVDIERLRPVDDEDAIVHRYFAPGEMRQYRSGEKSGADGGVLQYVDAQRGVREGGRQRPATRAQLVRSGSVATRGVSTAHARTRGPSGEVEPSLVFAAPAIHRRSCTGSRHRSARVLRLVGRRIGDNCVESPRLALEVVAPASILSV